MPRSADRGVGCEVTFVVKPGGTPSTSFVRFKRLDRAEREAPASACRDGFQCSGGARIRSQKSGWTREKRSDSSIESALEQPLSSGLELRFAARKTSRNERSPMSRCRFGARFVLERRCAFEECDFFLIEHEFF
jgi:hypothetical protein